MTTTTMVSVANIAALRAETTVQTEPTCYVEGYRTPGDGGEGAFWYDASDTTSVDNGGATIVDASGRRWKRALNSQPICANQFGASTTGGDATAAINAAIAYVAGNGGGIVDLLSGTYEIASTIVIATRVKLRGRGHGKTNIVAAAGTLMDMLQSYQFSTLTGSNLPTGPYQFCIEGISFNAGGTRSGGRCVALYGYDYVISDCEFFGAHGDGFYSEWGTSGSVPVAVGSNGMESRIENCKFFQNGANGLTFYGPHDSNIVNTLSFLNSGVGISISESASYSGSCNLVTVHSYSNGSLGIEVQAGVNMSGVQSESNTGGGILVTGAGWLLGSLVTAYSNGQYGITFSNNGFGSTLTTVFSYNNGLDGIVFSGSGNTLSGLTITNNKSNGLNILPSARATVVNGAVVESNALSGVSLTASDVSISGLFCAFNKGNGVSIANGVQTIALSGEFNSNTGAGIEFGSLGTGCMVDARVYTAAGQASYTGASGNNFVRLVGIGSDPAVINSYPT
ncbi:right-handed parallel beta-helix repeat-containing protein [Acidisoma sp. 7E03]